tara:strand:- start:4570 stop:5448 length:879 start_codon:yes stop_codon:yes gene_type:complete
LFFNHKFNKNKKTYFVELMKNIQILKIKNQLIVKKNDNKNELLIFTDALWETKILKKKCGKIITFRFSKTKIAKELLFELIRYLKKKNYYWIQLDSKNIFSKIKNLKKFIIKQKFEISNEYIKWRLIKSDINQNLLKLVSKNIMFNIATKKDLKKLQNFTEKFPNPGRFVLKKKFRKHGIKLYKSWVTNSILDKNKLVFFYKRKNRIYTYQTIELDKKYKVFSLGLLRNSQKIRLIGTYTVFNSIKYFESLKNMQVLYTKSSQFNTVINNLNKDVGMKKIASGINFEYFFKL